MIGNGPFKSFLIELVLKIRFYNFEIQSIFRQIEFSSDANIRKSFAES